MAHADTQTLLRNQAALNVEAQVGGYQKLAGRLHGAGAEHIAVTSIAGHFCIDAFKAGAPLPVIDMLDVVRLEVTRRGFRKVGLIGTRLVMDTQFYGVLGGVEVIAPGNLLEVHDAYVSMATAGMATAEHRKVFVEAGKSLSRAHGCESVLLGVPTWRWCSRRATNPASRPSTARKRTRRRLPGSQCKVVVSAKHEAYRSAQAQPMRLFGHFQPIATST